MSLDRHCSDQVVLIEALIKIWDSSPSGSCNQIRAFLMLTRLVAWQQIWMSREADREQQAHEQISCVSKIS